MMSVKLFRQIHAQSGFNYSVLSSVFRRGFLGLRSKQNEENSVLLGTVSNRLRTVYQNKLLPLEEQYLFHEFHSPMLTDQDFDAKPMIMFIGQYSTGKTTLIKYLLEQEFPGCHIGPEPTTDRFIVIMKGEKGNCIPGNALVLDPKKQFKPLTKFGTSFLNRFQCSLVESPVLDSVSIIDTPGILSGEKQRVDRGYDFAGVLEWFAERVDRIILLFDANKLDISDEFRRAIEALRGHDDKMRIVLNKADGVDHQSLLRVYGALMWSLGKVLNTPEVARVYVGSFWDEPLRYDINRRLFEDEEQDLMKDIQSLPRNSALRKINDISKRARLAKVHAHIIDAIYNKMPRFFGREQEKSNVIRDLESIYTEIEKQHQIPLGDFPELEKMQELLSHQDFDKFRPLDPQMLQRVEQMLAKDIADIMTLVPQEAATGVDIAGGVFARAQGSPFGYHLGEGANAGKHDQEWIVNTRKPKYDDIYKGLNPVNGKVMQSAVREEMMKSKLPNSVLGKIWRLADTDEDGLLDADEFALAMYLIDLRLDGHDLPMNLPDHLVPPSKRSKQRARSA
ncbi:EH domain-containing protein 1-like [Macrosteles quadrilineatus]|uniref:EH domain-containing protein 1-like n=1 Tax=Macrosteles quadrilineatus TaxID=74068 RepID=UPI0023E17D46|nr:EH domain-containing protein 1-like [Macrosteles quadrilineatus]